MNSYQASEKLDDDSFRDIPKVAGQQLPRTRSKKRWTMAKEIHLFFSSTTTLHTKTYTVNEGVVVRNDEMF